MATQTIYGSFQGSNASNYQIKCDCSSTSNNTNNYSNVIVKLYMRRSGNVTGQWNEIDSTSKIAIDGTDSGYSVTPFDTRSTTDWILLKTYTKNNIYHNSDGKKTINISANFNPNAASSLYGGAVSGSFKLDDIPRQAIITSAPDFNDEQNPTINYKNQAGDIVTSLQACISLTGSDADISYRDISKTGTSYTFNLTEAERNVLRNATKTSNTRTIVFIIKTILNGNTLYSSVKKTLSIINANPIFTSSNVTYEDTNSSVVAITKNNQHIVQNKSDVKVNYTSATALKGASISNYSFNLNGITQGVTGSSGSVIFGTINSSSDLTLTATATDSRGNKTSVTKKVTIFSYSVPTAIVTLNRLNNYEDTTYLTVDGTIASVNSKNVMTVKYRYKVKDGTYGAFTTISDNVKETISLNKNNEYIINVVVSDSFGETYDKEFPLGKGVFPLFIDVDKNSLGINCFPSNNGTIEIAGDNGNLVIYGMETGTWTPRIGALNETDPTVTYTIQRGTYTKFGKMVWIDFYLRGKITALNGTNNYACIKGLPFTAKEYGQGEHSFPVGLIYGLLDLSDATDNLAMGINVQVIRIQKSSGSAAANLKVTTTNYFSVGCSGWYETS